MFVEEEIGGAKVVRGLENKEAARRYASRKRNVLWNAHPRFALCATVG